MKKTQRFLLAAVLLALALGALVFLLGRGSKAFVCAKVKKDSGELTALAEAMLAGRAAGQYADYRITCWEGSGMVEFTAAAYGLGSATKYTGFYYSAADTPIGFQGAEVSFSADGDGWRWEEEGGDNWEYTERIQKNWYWFEMYF